MPEETAASILSAPPAAPVAPVAPLAGDPPAPITPPVGAPAGSNESKWWGTFADESTRGYAETKNFPTPEEAVRSYQNLEKLLGTKANAVIVPGDDAKPEDWAAFYDKAGRPAAPDNYPVPDALKADPVIKAFAPEAHKLGLNSKQFEGVMGFVNAQAEALATQQQGVSAAAADADMASLRSENPGIKYDALIENGRRAARSLALDGETLGKLETALGTKGMLSLMGKIGAGSAETPFIDGAPAGGAPSPEGARLELAALQKDQNFMKAWMGGDADKIARVNKLNAAIAGGVKQ